MSAESAGSLFELVLEPRYEVHDHELPRVAEHGHARRRQSAICPPCTACCHSEEHVREDPTLFARLSETTMFIGACSRSRMDVTSLRRIQRPSEHICDGSEVPGLEAREHAEARQSTRPGKTMDILVKSSIPSE